MQHLDWTATLNSIKESVPRAQFLSWIEPLEFIQRDETSVRLGVPSRLHEEMLKKHLHHHVLRAIEKQTGFPVQLEFEVLAKTNVEASFSAEIPATPAPAAAPQRPQLRVIEGSLATAPPPLEIEEREVVHRPLYPRPTSPFFEVEANRVALQVSRLLVDGIDPNLSSLVISGGIGMGKTHLLSTIGMMLEKRYPRLRIRYTNSESFTAEMIQSFRDNSTHLFKKKYREDTDVLLFDDVQELAGREKTQEQILHIFNELLTLGRRIIFTSNVPIHRLGKMIDPLRSRLLSLMSVEIGCPSVDQRLQLLTLACEHNKMIVDGAVLRHLSENGSQDIRGLLGSLVRLHMQSTLENKTLDADYVQRQNGIPQTTRSPVTIEEIVSLIELNFGVTREDLCKKGRKSNIAWARQVAMYLARHMTYLPLEEIGAHFGRDHATVLYSYEKVAEGIKTHRDVQLQLEYLLERLKAKAPRK